MLEQWFLVLQSLVDMTSSARPIGSRGFFAELKAERGKEKIYIQRYYKNLDGSFVPMNEGISLTRSEWLSLYSYEAPIVTLLELKREGSFYKLGAQNTFAKPTVTDDHLPICHIRKFERKDGLTLPTSQGIVLSREEVMDLMKLRKYFYDISKAKTSACQPAITKITKKIASRRFQPYPKVSNMLNC